MTFPYPLTPEVRADLWRFFGMADVDATSEAEHYDGPELPNGGVTRAGDALTDTPFARAFVAWREVRAGLAAEAAYKAGPSEERNCYTCRHNFIPARGPATCRNPGPEYNPARSEAVSLYSIASGAANAPDGMPKDRTIQCPGFSSKVLA